MNGTTPGGSPMEKIDGAKIRLLREKKELTQLYIATAVGVTVDTISRWENRRYPSVKRENALKLAEVLEVQLAEILETEEIHLPPEPEREAVPEPAPSPAARKPSQKGIQKILYLALPLFALLAAATVLWQTIAREQAVPVAAHRMLPEHIPAGQRFPVVISVDTPGNEESFSFMLTEELPQDCTVIVTDPPPAVIDRENGIIKWINKAGSPRKRFSYQMEVSAARHDGGFLRFSGSITLRKARAAKNRTTGQETVSIAPYHWADLNMDGIIDDEEILAVYDTYSFIEDLVDMNLVEEIWSGDGYRWDQGKQQYVIL